MKRNIITGLTSLLFAVITIISALADTSTATVPEIPETAGPELVAEPWNDQDNARIIYFGKDDSGFTQLSSSNAGREVIKTQECVVTMTDGAAMECTAPDGNIYTVDSEGCQLGQTVTLLFLLAV